MNRTLCILHSLLLSLVFNCSLHAPLTSDESDELLKNVRIRTIDFTIDTKKDQLSDEFHDTYIFSDSGKLFHRRIILPWKDDDVCFTIEQNFALPKKLFDSLAAIITATKILRLDNKYLEDPNYLPSRRLGIIYNICSEKEIKYRGTKDGCIPQNLLEFEKTLLQFVQQIDSVKISNPTVLWSYENQYATFEGSGVVDKFGTVYCSDRRALHAISMQSNLVWSSQVSDYSFFVSPPSIKNDSSVYLVISDYDHKTRLCAFDTQKGILQWEYPFHTFTVRSSPAIGLDGTLYLSDYDSCFYAFNPDGSRKWIYSTQKANDTNVLFKPSAPAISSDNIIYVGGTDNFFYALNAIGTLLWKFKTDGKIVSNPAIGSDGAIYFGSFDGCFYCLNKDGTMKWKCKNDSPITTSAAIGDDNSIYYISSEQTFVAVDANGSVKWNVQADPFDLFLCTPAIDSDGTIYMGTLHGNLYAFNPNGTILWSIKEYGNTCGRFLTIDSKGILYCTFGDKMVAIKTKAQGPARSSWPMYMHDAQHTSRQQ